VFKAPPRSILEMPPEPPVGASHEAHVDPRKLVVVLFVIGTVMAILVGYLGESGVIGGGVPGTYPPATKTATAICATHEGSSTTGSYHFWLVAGENATYTYNGTSPGPCLEVGVNSTVEITVSVASNAGTNHSFVIIPATGPTNVSPVFPGAGLSGAQRFVGMAPGTERNFTFTASTVGLYRYVCEVPGHFDLGMYGYFNVTAVAGVGAATAHASSVSATGSGVAARSSLDHSVRAQLLSRSRA
jgi:plastocyanin